MYLLWSAYALHDRVAIFDYIERDDPVAAVRVDTRIENEVERLAEFPEIGRPGRVMGTRELVITRTPYVVVYAFEQNAVTVLRILHGAQQWPDSAS